MRSLGKINSKDEHCYGYKCGANMGLESVLDAHFKGETTAYASKVF